MKESKKFLDTLQKLGEKWNISAALLLQEADGEQLSFCHGHADHAGKRPLTLEERYCFSARDYFSWPCACGAWRMKRKSASAIKFPNFCQNTGMLIALP